jgi:small ligand-binding sensory domain FIST
MRPAAVSTKVGVGASTSASSTGAAGEAAREAAAALAGTPADLAFLFLSPEHVSDAGAAAGEVREQLGPRHLVGCVAEGVVARGREFEQGPAAAVWAASLPEATIESFHAAVRSEDDKLAIEGVPPLDDADVVTLLVDPFTFPTGPFLAALNEQRPGVPLVGGIAAGAGRPGSQALILDDELHEEGAVGAVVSGVRVVTVVSQGCAPIGHDVVVTRAEGNVIFELAGRPALERLRSEIAGLSPPERELAAQGILAGLVIDENRPEYGRGDFLMRGVLGADEATGAIAIGEQVRVGQTVRFHVRDAQSADEDLRSSLEDRLGRSRAAGALVFTCNGRGTNMFAQPDHDARTVGEALGTDALAGFFCGGELGPVGGQVFLHGFTATLAVLLRD